MGQLSIVGTSEHCKTAAKKLRAATLSWVRTPAVRNFLPIWAHVDVHVIDPNDAVPIFGEPMHTACATPHDLYFCGEFVAAMNLKQVTYLVLHEILHVLMRHSVTHGPHLLKALERDDQRFVKLSALALDYVVNAVIEEDPVIRALVQPPTNVPPLYDARFSGMSWVQVYHELCKQSVTVSVPMDVHDVVLHLKPAAPDDADEQAKQQNKDAKLERTCQQVAVARAMSADAGKTSRAMLTATAPKVPWHEKLRALLVNSSRKPAYTTWAKPSRRGMAMGIPIPGTQHKLAVDELVIAIDTSGSISDNELAIALAHLLSIIKEMSPKRVHVLWVDAEVAGVQVFEEQDFPRMATLMKPTGFGGTDMRTIFPWVADNVKRCVGVVVFTDGYTPWPTEADMPKYPVYWCINTSVTAPRGTTLSM